MRFILIIFILIVGSDIKVVEIIMFVIVIGWILFFVEFGFISLVWVVFLVIRGRFIVVRISVVIEVIL